MRLHRLALSFAGAAQFRDRYPSVKDPCAVHDGTGWHLYGTGITGRPGPDAFEVLHATAARPEGPWRLREPLDTRGVSGSCVAAPGAVADTDGVHLFLQTDFNRPGGRLEHLLASDGEQFEHRGTALSGAAGAGEDGVYDPHPALVDGVPHLAYAAFSTVGSPQLHLARSDRGWDGPWQRLGPVLRQADVPGHNQPGDPSYEWGLEGPQLLQLPGEVLLTAVLFRAGAPAGSRQRAFLARSSSTLGPWRVGPTVAPARRRLSLFRRGENGHASLANDGGRLLLFFQERAGTGSAWGYALAEITAP